jgi:hypothetical protein
MGEKQYKQSQNTNDIWGNIATHINDKELLPLIYKEQIEVDSRPTEK